MTRTPARNIDDSCVGDEVIVYCNGIDVSRGLIIPYIRSHKGASGYAVLKGKFIFPISINDEVEFLD